MSSLIKIAIAFIKIAIAFVEQKAVGTLLAEKTNVRKTVSADKLYIHIRAFQLTNYIFTSVGFVLIDRSFSIKQTTELTNKYDCKFEKILFTLKICSNLCGF